MKRKTYEAARDKWPQILAALGFPESALSGKHGPCPCTGEGTDRFRFADNGRGAYHCHCTQDGDNSGFDLIRCWKGLEFREAAAMVDEVLGNGDIKPSKPKNKPDPLPRLRRCYEESHAPGLAVRRYCTNRKIPTSKIMREICNGKRPDGSGLSFSMMCPIFDHKGAVSVHLTYLDQQGRAIEQGGTRKRVLPPLRPMVNGYWIPLAQEGNHLFVAEGIETAMSAIPLFGAKAVFALVSTHGMKTFRVPEQYTAMTVLADNDNNFAGQSAAYELANKAALKGVSVDVLIPEMGDFNDELRNTA